MCKVSLKELIWLLLLNVSGAGGVGDFKIPVSDFKVFLYFKNSIKIHLESNSRQVDLFFFLYSELIVLY